MSGNLNYVRFLSGLITEEEMRSQIEPQASMGAAQPATSPVPQPATQDAAFNFTNPVVAGRKVDRHQMHKDFYWWMQQQDRNDYELAELFDALAHSSQAITASDAMSDRGNLPPWLSDRVSRGEIVFADEGIYVTTLEGTMFAGSEDWVLCGIKGEVYPCKADIFEHTYDVIT